MLLRITAALALLLACSSAAAAQAPPCRETLDSLDVKIRRNYAGHMLEVTGVRARAHADTLAGLRRAADATAVDACFPVLRALTEWYDDPHLFVYQNADADTAGRRQHAQAARRTTWTESSVHAYLQRSAGSLDPIEGIWYEPGLRLGVVRDSGDAFIAVVLTPDTIAWPVGAVRARFVRRGDSYDATVFTKLFGVRSLRAVVHRNALLRMSPGVWGKAYPLPPADSGFLHPADPRRPTLRLVDDAPVLTIPSHDPQYAPVLDSLVQANAPLLARAPLLLIDVRGNEGGSSWITRPLHPYIASATPRRTPYDDGDAVMLSSPDQIRYTQRAFGADTTAFVRSLLERMRARPGELVPFEDPAAPAPTVGDSVLPGVRAVGVLVDRGTVSAAEVLVLRALRSSHARVFGEPTAGALDYQSTSVVRLHPDESRWLLGYPTITRKATLPEGGMRGRGIPPDVHVRWSEVADPVRFVLGQLQALNAR